MINIRDNRRAYEAPDCKQRLIYYFRYLAAVFFFNPGENILSVVPDVIVPHFAAARAVAINYLSR